MNEAQSIKEARVLLEQLSHVAEESKSMSIHLKTDGTTRCVYDYVSSHVKQDIDRVLCTREKLDKLREQISTCQSHDGHQQEQEQEQDMKYQELQYQYAKTEELYWFHRMFLVIYKAKALKFIEYDTGKASKKELKHVVFGTDYFDAIQESPEYKETIERESQAMIIRSALKVERREKYKHYEEQLRGINKLNCVADFIHDLGGLDNFLALQTDILQNKAAVSKEEQLTRLSSWMYMADCLQEKGQLKRIFTRPFFVESDNQDTK